MIKHQFNVMLLSDVKRYQVNERGFERW